MEPSESPSQKYDEASHRIVKETNGTEGPNKNAKTSSKNATDSHPLMHTLRSPVQDFPDLIPEKPKKSYDKQKFTETIHGTSVDAETNTPETVFKKNYTFQLQKLDEYNEKLPGKKNIGNFVPSVGIINEIILDFPDSPSAMKKSLMFDMPVEISHHELSDPENEKSLYEAHLSSNLQNVSLKLNDKEGKYCSYVFPTPYHI